jgi:hypothetical protein
MTPDQHKFPFEFLQVMGGQCPPATQTKVEFKDIEVC